MAVVIGTSVLLFGLVVARMAGPVPPAGALHRPRARAQRGRRRARGSQHARGHLRGRPERGAASWPARARRCGCACARRTLTRVVAEDPLRRSGRGRSGRRPPPSWWPPRPARAAVARRSTDLRSDLLLPPAAKSLLVHALEWDGQTHGLLVTADETTPSLSVQGSLQALASQVSLALESAALTEEVHRAHAARPASARSCGTPATSSPCSTPTRPSLYQSPSIERVLGYTRRGGRRHALRRAARARPETSRLLHLLADGTDVRRPRAARSSSARCATATAALRQFEILHTNLLARRARPRHRAQRPRRQRAQGVRGAARPPGLPRPGHRPGQPRAVRRARAPRGRPHPARATTAWP